jgi:7-keto-8-aminopelargonate synthetase-like enzyme
MPRWIDELRGDLNRLEEAHLLRRLVVVDRADAPEPPGRLIRREGRTLVNFASNDYLGLSDHPKLKQAAIDATARMGTGAGASRLVTGHLSVHADVETRFARFKHAQAALLCPTGYLANLAVLTTLAAPGDLICLDKLCHASLIDAARASGATVRIYPHLNTTKLERLLERDGRPAVRTELVQFEDRETGPVPLAAPPVARTPRRFIVTDSVFSMDGDAADLPALCELAARHDAILIVDEAHGTGVLGQTGAGLCEAQGVSDRVDIVISTASKALGGLGGIITARQVVIDSLINHARSFIYTTAVPAAQAATIIAALEVVRDEPWRRRRVLELAQRVRRMLGNAKPDTHRDGGADAVAAGLLTTPIIPLITGSPESALALSAHLADQGIHAPAIRPPTVAPSAARVRLSLRADMTDDDIEHLRRALNR